MMLRLVTARLSIAMQRHSALRTFSAASLSRQPQKPPSFDAIQSAVHSILSEYEHHHDNGSNKAHQVSDEDLQASAQRFQTILQEAQNCVLDCRSADGSLINEEMEAADNALSEASAALVDLIDDLRQASHVQSSQYNEIRDKSALMIRQLRCELDDIGHGKAPM